MAKQKKLGLNSVFPLGADTTTDAALASSFPDIAVEEQLRSVVQDIGRTYTHIPTDKIHPNPFQPRKHFDQQKLQELAQSLEQDGMLQPLLVRMSPTQPDTYEIAAGERRWRAAKLANMVECPAEIMRDCPDAKMKRIALLENIQREQLTPLELAVTYDALLQELDDQGKPVYTVRELAQMLGKDKGHVDDHRSLLRVPQEVRQLIEDDPDIPVRVIRELGNVEDERDRAYLIEEVRARNLKTADVVALLQKNRQRRREQSSTTSQLEDVAVARHQQDQEEQGVPDTVTVVQHERTARKPSPSMALDMLDVKLRKDQTQLQKAVERVLSELPTLSEEEKALVRSYLERWRDTIQRLEEQL